MEGLSEGQRLRPLDSSPREVRTDKALIVSSMVLAVGIPRLQAGEDVKLRESVMPTADEVYQARYDARLNQRAAAELLGVSKRAWESWESGARNMSVDKLILFKLLVARRELEQVQNEHD